jgi:hypothetical protein
MSCVAPKNRRESHKQLDARRCNGPGSGISSNSGTIAGQKRAGLPRAEIWAVRLAVCSRRQGSRLRVVNVEHEIKLLATVKPRYKDHAI